MKNYTVISILVSFYQKKLSKMCRLNVILTSLLINCISIQIYASTPEWERVYEGGINGHIAQLYNGGMSITKPVFIDIDNDNDQDLFIGRASGDVRYYKNTGTPDKPSFSLQDDNFLSIIGNSYGDQSGTHICPVFVDIDDDKDYDLIYGEYTGKLKYYQNNGTSYTPNFISSNNYFSSITVDGFAQPFFCDIDADGDYDLFVGYGVNPGGSSGGIKFYRNIGTSEIPNFSFVSSSFIPSRTEPDQHPTFVDIDGDKDFDLFIGTYSGSIFFYRNIGTESSPNFVDEEDPLPFFSIDLWISETFSDLDNDGDWDCFVGGQCGSILYFENIGTCSFPSFISPKISIPGIDFTLEVGGWGLWKGQHSIPALVDIDDDGDLDLFTSQYNPGQINFYRNDGSPKNPIFTMITAKYGNISFTSTHDPAVLGHICFGDIDNDDDLDLFIGKEDGKVIFYRNNGNKKDPSWILVNSSYINALVGDSSVWAAPTLIDIDGDGDLDFIVGERWGNILLFRNNGTSTTPSFSGYTNLGLNPGYFPKPSLYDVDKDGDFDLFIGVEGSYGNARIIFYKNIGTSSNPIFSLENNDFATIDKNYTYPAPIFSDLDGDGDMDLICGSERGGINFYKNNSTHLMITPNTTTLINGTSILFQTTGNTGTVTYNFVRNPSNATLLSDGHYTSGEATGEIDIIEAKDATNIIGRAYINVISPTQLTASGKAVVMAGKKGNDSLWTTTNELANFVYRMLIYRGFSKTNVQYMSNDVNQDVDGNGSNDDIDTASSLTAIEQALSSFAAGSPNLFVYLIDHGSADFEGNNGSFNCNPSDQLSAAQLDAMLDNLQTNENVTTITLVVDCCQSGAFLKQCAGAPAGKARIVISSSDSLKPAVFTAGGLISFTNGFVSSLFAGLSVGSAFDLASGSMDFIQKAQLDDTGDGIYNKDSDGNIANRTTIGASFIAGADRPQIGKITPNLTLTGGSTSALIWASEVSGVYPIQNVWATIAQPGLASDAYLTPDKPIENLPKITLAWDSVDQRYEATTDTFTLLGAYAVNIYAEDIWGGVSYPKQTYINQINSDERIIIVCGDGAYDGDSPWAYSNYLANIVYETAKARWISDSNITYLSSSSGTYVDGTPTKTNLQNAIAAASGISKLTVYLVGKGSGTSFDIDGDGSDADDVSPSEMDGWLDSIQTSGNTTEIVILDFIQSGAWISSLIPPSGKKRIVITSCSPAENSWCEAGGIISFTEWFFNGIFNGSNVRNSFLWGRSAIRNITNFSQNPIFDDNGSGTNTSQDGALAAVTYIGAAFVTGADAPIIGDYAKDRDLPTNTETLWASGVWSSVGIREVFAYVIRSGSSSTTKVDLAYNPATSRWEAVYSGFIPNEKHTIVYFAKDKSETLSEPYTTNFGDSGSSVNDWMLF